MRKAATLFCLFILSAILVNAVEHPNLKRGYVPSSMLSTPQPDSINLFNGNLTINLPLGQIYQVSPALSYSFSLHYNAHVWDYFDRLDVLADANYTRAYPDLTSNVGMGWRISLGDLLYPGGPLDMGRLNSTDAWVYVSPDGGSHPFYSKLHESDDGGGSCTRDGSYLRLKDIGVNTETGLPNRTVEFPSGKIATFEEYEGDPHHLWRLVSIKDSFGNSLNITYTTDEVSNEETWNIADSTGRESQLVFDQVFDPDIQSIRLRLKSITAPAFGNTTASYIFQYDETQSIPRSGKRDDPEQSDDVDVDFLRRITYPDGGNPDAGEECTDCSYATFSYNLEASRVPESRNADGVSGAIREMRTPTGGKISWTYQTYRFPTGDTLCGNTDPYPWVNSVVGTSTGVATRTVEPGAGKPKGVWYYVHSDPDDEDDIDVTAAVTAPSGDVTVHYFNTNIVRCADDWTGWDYGLPYTRRFNIGQRHLSTVSYGADDLLHPLRKTYVLYERDQLPEDPAVASPRFWYDVNRRFAGSETLFLDDTVGKDWGRKTFALSDFDGLGHYRKETVGGNFPGAGDRIHYTGFSPRYVNETLLHPEYRLDSNNAMNGDYTTYPVDKPWIHNVFDLKWTQEGGKELRQDFCFDWLAPDFYPDKGFMTGITTHKDTSIPSPRSEDDLSHRFFVSTNLPGAVGREEFYGGDVQTLPTEDWVCNPLPLTLDPVYRINHQYSSGVLSYSYYEDVDGDVDPETLSIVHQNIDVNTGLASKTYDVSGLWTSFDYDALGRVTKVSPQEGADTLISYTAAENEGSSLVKATADQKAVSADINHTTLAESKYLYDGFGRLEEENHLLADGSWNQRLTSYDTMGRTDTVSEWQPDGMTAVSNNAYTYDPFGRIKTITKPDGHKTSYDYQGERVKRRTAKIGTTFLQENQEVVEQDVTTTEYYDNFGRLHQVDQPLSSVWDTITTTYGYDGADHLVSANMSHGQNTQTREFSYDGLGFMRSRILPETSSATLYSNYDPLGLVGRVDDGENELDYSYDFAGRNSEISDSSTSAILKQYSYYLEGGDTRACWGWNCGKLFSTIAYNYFGAGAPWDRAATVEIYSYNGLGGRIDERQTSITFDSNPPTAFHFHQNWIWNDLGRIATISYPEVTSNDATLPDLSQSNIYTNGWLTSVNPGVAKIGYYPNGMLALLNYNGMDGHGLGVSWLRDPDWMQRPRGISFNERRFDAEYGFSGEFEFDGMGNITAKRNYIFRDGGPSETGSRFNIYDMMGRLKASMATATTENPQFNWNSTFDYDAFGNLTSQTLNDSTVNVNVSKVNNHISGAQYDNAGRQRSWGSGGQTYSYDFTPFHQIKKYSAPGATRYFVYNADGERLYSFDPGTSTGTLTLRDLDAKVLRTITQQASGALDWERDYLYAGHTLVGAKSPEGDFRLFADELGSVELITTWDEGYVVERNEYFPFGQELGQEALASPQKLRFTGHERDSMSPSGSTDDLDYMHARHYNLNLGRFLSPDPAPADPANPQSWNAYAYVLNNPLKYTDPFGLSEADRMRGACAGSAAADQLCFQGEIKVTAPDPEEHQMAQKAAVATLELVLHRISIVRQHIHGWTHSGSVWNLSSHPIVVTGNNPNDPNGKGQLAVTIPPNTWSRELKLPFAYNDVDTVIYGDDAIKIPGRVSAWVVLPDFLTPKSFRGPIGVLLRGGPVAPVFSLTKLSPKSRDGKQQTEFESEFGALSW